MTPPRMKNTTCAIDGCVCSAVNVAEHFREDTVDGHCNRNPSPADDHVRYNLKCVKENADGHEEY